MSQWPTARPPKKAAAPKRERQPRRVATHVFVSGGQVDHAGVGICEVCGNLRTNPVHDLTVLTEDVAVIDRRRIGEGSSE